jgi:hypothetical protein
MSDTAKFILKVIGILLFVLLAVYLVADIFNVITDFTGWDPNGGKADVFVAPIEDSMKILRNGDLTVVEIEQQKEDADAPTCDDIFNDFYLYESDKFVFVSRRCVDGGKYIFPTLSFIKTQNGNLQFDGAIGIKASIEVNWWSGVPNFNSLKFTFDLTQGVNYEFDAKVDFANIVSGVLTTAYDNFLHGNNNFVSFHNFSTSYCGNFLKMNAFARTVRQLSGSEKNDTNQLKNLTFEYIQKNIVPYFTDMGSDIEMIFACKGLEESERKSLSISYLNSYITHMWTQSKTEDKTENQKVVDLSEYFARFIYDEDIYKNYPIPDSKKTEYGDKKYYTVYNCKIFGNCMYSYYETNVACLTTGTLPAGDGDFVVTPPPVITKEYTKVNIKLNNKNNSNLDTVDLKVNPVVIEINDKTLTFDSLLSIRQGKSFAIESNKNYNYEIISNTLIFDSYSGTFETKGTEQTMTFDFSYTNGYCLVSVELQNITTIDMSKVDLEKYPVKIIYNSKTGGSPQQFIFNKNEDITKKKTALMKIGDYDYSVLSEQLIFSSTTGTQSISTTNREFLFTYSLAVYQDDLKFTVTVQESSSSSQDLQIRAEADTVSLLGDKIGQTGYSVIVKIFDKDGYIVKTCNHTHSSGSSLCSELWTSNGALKVGETYTGQLLYVNTKDNSKSYVSGTFTFTYKNNTLFTFMYECVEV